MTQPTRTFRVMQLIDTLELGGAERMAVNIANGLSGRGHESFLCATRASGPLKHSMHEAVGFLNLGRRARFDIAAIRRLSKFIKENQIEILHAHTSSVFIAIIAKVFSKHLAVIWHDHNGNPTTRTSFPFRLISRGVDFAIAVNSEIRQWMIETVGLNPRKVTYLPNFTVLDESQPLIEELPGQDGFRIICVANIRPQKDHMNLLKAFVKVVGAEARAHLILVGEAPDPELLNQIKQFIDSSGLSQSVSILGKRQDVHSIMKACDIGVLSSKSEGLPVALLEYGLAGLPVVATDVGQCGEVLDHGYAGIAVPPDNSGRLGEALIGLLQNTAEANALVARLSERVREEYSADAFLNHLEGIYASL